MLKLINIKRDDSFIEANYIPEDSKEIGYVKINMSDNMVIEAKKTSLDGNMNMYFAHAREKLRDMKNDVDLPGERLVMWY